MKYENGKDIFPEDLLKEIQKYAAGKVVYIPTGEEKRSWGETSGYKEYLAQRNTDIREKFISGTGIEQLACDYFLSVESIKKIVYSKKERNKMANLPFDKTQTFDIPAEHEYTTLEILRAVYSALVEKGYDPVNQLVGYIVSEDPTYITNHKNARSLICRIDRDELMSNLIKSYLGIAGR